MSIRAFVLLSSVALLLMNIGCEQAGPTGPSGEKTTVYSGTVVDSVGNVVDIARVEDIGAFATFDSTKIGDTTRADGYFKLQWQLSNDYNTSIVTTRRGYFTDTQKVTLKPGDVLTGNVIRLRVRDSVLTGRGVSGQAVSITLRKQTATTIALRGTGKDESSTLTFVVKDSTGTPVVGANRSLVNFVISGGPNGGEYVMPSSAWTDQITGEVSTTVNSGTKPGVLQVIASTRGDTVKASPVTLAAGGGLPDSAGVSIGATKFNIAGRVYGNLQTTIGVTVVDRFGGPVADGTIVSFTAPGARLSAFAATTSSGIAQVDLYSTSNPLPGGYITVTATTTGDKYYRPSDSSIVRTIDILFSGPTQPPAPPANAQTFSIPDGESSSFDFIVSDDLGNPLVKDTKIIVTAKGADTLMSDLNILNGLQVMKDEWRQSATQFTVKVQDKGKGKASGFVYFGIEIVSENGNYKNENWFTGYIGAGTGGNFNVPVSIELTDSSVKSLYLAESGISREITKTVTFVVRDGYGNPISSSSRKEVVYSLDSDLGQATEVTLDTYSDTTDDRGRVSVNISSGNKTEVVQIKARTNGAVGPVEGSSQDISVMHGLPDSGKIFLELDKKNFFNSGQIIKVGTVSLRLIDKDDYSPAPQKTIRFITTGGWITGTAPQTIDGRTSVELKGGSEPTDPTLGPGYGYVSAMIPVHGGVTVTRSVPFLFSYSPQISFTNTAIVDTAANKIISPIVDGGSINLDFDVQDKNGNPISSANSLSVTVTGNVGQELEATGDISISAFEDTQDSSMTHFRVTINDKLPGAGTQGSFKVTFRITGESGTVIEVLDGTLLPPVQAEKVSFITASATILGVSGSGPISTSTSQVTFRVTDRNGIQIDANNWVYVDFAILDTTGGTYIFPSRVKTDANGEATTTLYAGRKYGKYQVVASFVPKNSSTTISSSPTDITVSGPYPANFTLNMPKKNIPGLGVLPSTSVGTIIAQVMDSVNIPVPSGTLVSFRSTGGIIDNPVNVDKGSAIAKIYGGAAPNTPALGGKGYGYVYASVLGNNGATIIDSLPFMFSGPPTSILFTNSSGVPTTPLSTPIADGATADVYFKVRDANWRPVSEDYSIAVTTEGDSGSLNIEVKNISVIRDISSMSDTSQLCRFQLVNTPGGVGGAFRAVITVSGQYGTYSNTITGTIQSQAGLVSGYASSINLLSKSSSTTSVRGTGASEVSTLVWQVKDSLGNPISSTRSCVVQFTINGGPGGGEFMNPTSVTTDGNGQATTTFNSGTIPGVVQVQATTIVNARTITSSPVSITIQGGLPNQAHFTLRWTTQDTLINVPGIVTTAQLASVSVLAGDMYGNPVQPGTALYFSTSGGVIQPSALTDADGRATVNLYGGNPVPSDPTLGYGYVRVRTVGEGGVVVKDSVKYLFTGSPVISTFGVDSVSVSDGGSVVLPYSIFDVNNKALAGGNQISVTIEGAAASTLKLEGDGSVPFLSPANRITPGQYSMRISDATPNGGISGTFTLRMTVSGWSGSTSKIIYGRVGAATSGYASSITLLPLSNTTTSIRGTGATETTQLIWQVKDSSGNVITPDRAVIVQFSFAGIPLNGGEFLYPTSVATNDQGQVTTTFNSGTKPGVVQVKASATVGSRTITSSPAFITINSGLPDQRHFTLRWGSNGTFANFPGMVTTNSVGLLTVLVGDTFSNPVQNGTALYFNSDAGVIQAQAATSNGSASVTFYGGNPPPTYLVPTGYGYVRAWTMGMNGVVVKDSLPFLFSGKPRIITSTDSISVNDGGYQDITFSFADTNNNAVAGGNSFVVTLSGLASSSISLNGVISGNTPDNKLTPETYSLRLSDNTPDGGPSGAFTATISITGPSGTVSKTIIGNLRSATVIAPTAPAKILTANVSKNLIAARGTGGEYTSDITFQVVDASGRSIGAAQSDTVFFTLSDTSGGSYLIPSWAFSDANGQATTKLYSGIKYGTPTVTARMKTIQSLPEAVRISGPAWSNFNANLALTNLAGLSQIGRAVGTINIQVGDTLGNPVLSGTTVKFTTSGGMVDPSASTATDGSATVNLYGGAVPNTPALGGIGWGYVVAKVQGNNGAILQKTVPYLFSGAPIITTQNLPSSDTIIVYDAGWVDVDYKIADINRNPLAASNQVTVSVSGAASTEIVLSNYYNFTTTGTTDTNQTIFRVRFADARPSSGSGGAFDVSISVNGVNGTTRRDFHGILLAPSAIMPPSPEVKKAAQIAYISTSASDIYIAGVGALENAVVTYEVRDSLGFPVESTPRYGATFAVNFFPNVNVGGGTAPKVIPSADSTDTQGRLHASIVSGTQAGVIELVAQIALPGPKIISSQPVRITVHAGFPDQNHFTILPSRWVFPSMDYMYAPYPRFTVAVGDTFSNPVPTGTAVYFHTQAGIIQTGNQDFRAYTDISGLASVNLLTVNPRPSVLPYYDNTALSGRIGGHWVYAQTQGKNGKTIADSVLVIWNKGPIVWNLKGLGPYVYPSISMSSFGASDTIGLVVKDVNGNPLCDGTTISVSISWPTSVTGLAFDCSGDFTTTRPFAVPNAAYARYPGNRVTNFVFRIVDNSTTNFAGGQITVTLTINSPGVEERIVSFPVTIL